MPTDDIPALIATTQTNIQANISDLGEQINARITSLETSVNARLASLERSVEGMPGQYATVREVSDLKTQVATLQSQFVSATERSADRLIAAQAAANAQQHTAPASAPAAASAQQMLPLAQAAAKGEIGSTLINVGVRFIGWIVAFVIFLLGIIAPHMTWHP